METQPPNRELEMRNSELRLPHSFLGTQGLESFVARRQLRRYFACTVRLCQANLCEFAGSG
jgi:hypothetical protein